MYGRPGRLPELFESIKTEFDNILHECSMYKMQRDDYERKLQAQVTELASIQNALVELERKHNKLKRHYEDEFLRLQNMQHLPNERNTFSGSITDQRKPPEVEEHNLPSLIHPRPETSTFFSGAADLARIGTPNLGTPNLGKRPQREPESSKFSSTADLPAIHTPKIHKSSDESTPQQVPQIPTHMVPPQQSNGLGGSVSKAPNNSPLKPTPMEEDIPPISAENMPIHIMEDRMDRDSVYKIGHNQSVQQKLGISLAYELDHTTVVCCVKFSSDGKYLATGCNRKAQIFAVETGDRVHTFTDEAWTGEDLYLRSVCFSPDGRYLACGAEDKTVKVWDIEKETIYHTFDGHTMDIYSVDYSSDGRFIVSGSGDKKARIWDVEKKKCLFHLGTDEVGPKDGVTSVAISPDGRLIAAGSLDRIVRLWDAQTGYFLERYEGHMDSVYSVAFSPDGKSLASGSLDRTLKLWDLSESRSRSRCRSTFSGHSDFVLSVAFSPDGNWLISGSKDRSVQFWDPRTAISHTKLEGHKNSVISISVNPTNGTFATGSGDCKAKVWRYA